MTAASAVGAVFSPRVARALIAETEPVVRGIRASHLVDCTAAEPEALHSFLSSHYTHSITANLVVLHLLGQQFIANRAALAAAAANLLAASAPRQCVICVGLSWPSPTLLTGAAYAAWHTGFSAAISSIRDVVAAAPATGVVRPPAPSCDLTAVAGWLCGYPVLYDTSFAPPLSAEAASTPPEAAGAATAAVPSPSGCGDAFALAPSRRHRRKLRAAAEDAACTSSAPPASPVSAAGVVGNRLCGEPLHVVRVTAQTTATGAAAGASSGETVRGRDGNGARGPGTAGGSAQWSFSCPSRFWRPRDTDAGSDAGTGDAAAAGAVTACIERYLGALTASPSAAGDADGAGVCGAGSGGMTVSVMHEEVTLDTVAL